MTAPREIALLDMEWTSWEGAQARGWSGPGEYREVVQIGLIKVADTPELPETDAFQAFVKPIRNPVLSDYFKNLTGIRQEDVDRDGVTLAEAVEAMSGFLGDPTMPVYSHGGDGKRLRENCEEIDIDFIFDPNRFVDMTAPIAEFLGVRIGSLVSSTLPGAMGFEAPGTAHDAVDDCRCVAGALRILRASGQF